MKKQLLSITNKSLKSRSLKAILLFFSMSLLITLKTSALSPGDFNAGYIISDNVFTNKSSMSASQIQTFLDSKVTTCDTKGLQLSEYGGSDLNGDGKVQRWEWGKENYNQTVFVCLKDYKEDDKSAAQIIYDTAVEFSINPQVLIVLLQKEQALVTDTWPLDIQYRSATGYGCPDTADCDTRYYGFKNQIRWSAYMYHAIMTNDLDWYAPYGLKENYIQYNPNASCGGSVVDIKNRATQSLYNYTPYQPNEAVLEWKLGDGPYVSSSYPGCGAFGNVNFYTYFTEWFGSTIGVDIYAIRYDTTTSNDGEQAKIGFGLTQKPTADVTLKFYVSSPSNAKIVSETTLVINKETWNIPEKNIITIAGVYNENLIGNFEYYLKLAARPSSLDKRYTVLGSDSVSIALLQQDTKNDYDVYKLKSADSTQQTITASVIEKNTLLNEGWVNESIAFSYCPVGEKTIVKMSNEAASRLVIQNSAAQKEAVEQGYLNETLLFSVSSQGTVPVYWLYDETNDESIYTTNPIEDLTEGYINKGIVFYSCKPSNVPVYRLYKINGSHLFTKSATERDKAIYTLGYRYEGLGFYSCSAGDRPVYRLIREANGVRLFTTSKRERDKAVGLGYTYEGVSFSQCEDSSREVFRLYNAETGRRFFTISANERDNAVKTYGFTYEGVGFVAE
jgi:hypothetical protein